MKDTEGLKFFAPLGVLQTIRHCLFKRWVITSGEVALDSAGFTKILMAFRRRQFIIMITALVFCCKYSQRFERKEVFLLMNDFNVESPPYVKMAAF